MQERAAALQQPDPVNVILLGSPKSGKTAIFNSLQQREVGEDYFPTVATELAAKECKSQEAPQPLTLHIRDLSGDERFSFLQGNDYRSANIAIFALDGSQPLAAQEEYLLKKKIQIQQSNAEVLCVLVVTKNELRQQILGADIDALRKKMQIEEANVVADFSAKRKKAVDDLNDLLVARAHAQVVAKQQARSTRKQIKALFKEAKKAIEDGEVSKLYFTQASAPGYLQWLAEVTASVNEDLSAKRITLEQAQAIATQVRDVSLAVGACQVGLMDAITTFHTQVQPHKQSSRLAKALGGLIGVALGIVIGVAIGAIIGAGTGPGAIFTALAGGIKGACIGASIGTSLALAASAAGGAGVGHWFSLWRNPLSRLERQARDIERLRAQNTPDSPDGLAVPNSSDDFDSPDSPKSPGRSEASSLSRFWSSAPSRPASKVSVSEWLPSLDLSESPDGLDDFDSSDSPESPVGYKALTSSGI